MKKFYKIILLLTAFTFLTTYTPGKFNKLPEKENNFFKIKNIKIINNNLISEKEIVEKLAQIYDRNILFIKRKDIEKPLQLINFLEKIEVKKKYPNTIIVTIYETKPVAIIFKKKEKYLLDSLSRLVLHKKDVSFFDKLPSIFGEGGEKNFISFYKNLEKNNFPKEKIKNYYYFKLNRWDLQLFNNQIIKFPSDKVSEAIQQAVELLGREDFKNYNIIDLRMDGKIVVE